MTKPESQLKPSTFPASLRIPVLAVLLTGAVVGLGRAIVTPKPPPVLAGAGLPNAVPVAGWQPAANTTALKPADDGVTGQLYQYRPSTSSSPSSSTAPVMQVELRQVLGDGNNSRFLFIYSVIRQGNNKIQERRSETGVHGVLSHNGRAYLTACINPDGGSTVTEQQFAQNRSQNIWQVGRIVPWIMGQQGSLSDKRCLWTLMSLPIDRSQPEAVATEAAYKTLETAWVPWYRWWQQNFPPTPY